MKRTDIRPPAAILATLIAFASAYAIDQAVGITDLTFFAIVQVVFFALYAPAAWWWANRE